MSRAFDRDNFTAAGHMLENGSMEPYTLTVSEGKMSLERGWPDDPDLCGTFIWDVVNAHMHCADYGLKVPKGMTLEDLVAPPDGLKHRYLRECGEEGLRRNMADFDRASASYGAASFIDFREGGVAGCRLLRQESQDAIIMGRPISKEFDPEEVAELLEVADGIGLPSISDMPLDYVEQVADAAREARRPFAIHVSERIREDIDTVLSLDPAFIVHMCEATDDDLAKCAEAEVPIVVCPTSNSYFGKEAPVSRMIAQGVDVAVGTDNGMLCEPDIIKETMRIASLLEKQGCDTECVVPILLKNSSKLLYRTSRMTCWIPERYMTVIPRAEGTDGKRCSTVAPFRIKKNRGSELNGVQQDSGTNRRKRIYQARHQAGGRTGQVGRG